MSCVQGPDQEGMTLLLSCCRYKQEILWLRTLAGNKEPRTLSAGAADAPLLPGSRRTPSQGL